MSNREDIPEHLVDSTVDVLIEGMAKNPEQLTETFKLHELMEGIPDDRAELIREACGKSIQELAGVTLKATLPVIIEELLPKMLDARMRRVVEDRLPDMLPGFLDKAGMIVESVALILELASRTNDSREDVLRKALNLYQILLDAHDEGNRLAILSPDNIIVHEVVGYELPENADLQTTDRGSHSR